jgi:hypothetical protein
VPPPRYPDFSFCARDHVNPDADAPTRNVEYDSLDDLHEAVEAADTSATTGSRQTG